MIFINKAHSSLALTLQVSRAAMGLWTRLYNIPLRWINIILILQMENQDTERLSILFKVTLEICGRSWNRTQVSRLSDTCCQKVSLTLTLSKANSMVHRNDKLVFLPLPLPLHYFPLLPSEVWERAFKEERNLDSGLLAVRGKSKHPVETTT